MFVKRFILLVVLIGVFLGVVAGCQVSSSTERSLKDMKSEYGGGLNRTITVFSYDGKILATFSGKVDMDSQSTAGKVKFDLNGKRYIFYNAVVEVAEK